MASFKRKRLLISMNAIALFMIIFANISLYNAKMLFLYKIVSGVGIIFAMGQNVQRLFKPVLKTNTIFWLTCTYAIYIFYEIFFLRAGNLNWDTLLWRYFENVSMYLCLTSIISSNERIDIPYSLAGILSALILVYNEGAKLLLGGVRIGNTLSGNENTVGFSFGIITLVLTWVYCKNKMKSNIILIFIFLILMLLTGSKKGILILIADIFLYFYFNKDKFTGKVKIALIIFLCVYSIFGIPTIYNIIGYRIVSMIETMIYRGNNNVHFASYVYSYSTDVRIDMIKEAIEFFKENPLFGGGYNYFLAHTQYPYEYSHCNYTELLCDFGIVGTGIYYYRHYFNIKFCVKRLKNRCLKYKDECVFALIIMILTLLMDWNMVPFSSISIWYTPIIISSAYVDCICKDRKEIR